LEPLFKSDGLETLKLESLFKGWNEVVKAIRIALFFASVDASDAGDW